MLTVNQENEYQSVAPTLGTPSGIIGQGIIPGQTRAVTPRQKGSGRFTNLQSYIRANEPESGGLNPNARLIQQRAEQAGTQLGQRQTEFTKGLEPIRTGLEGIQERASVAQSAFQDPTKFVQSPENLKRFTALRTGQEKIPGVTETYGQIEPLRQGLTSQQRQIAEGLRTDVGQNLQDYIRSQRPNPALATLGETQLDRFLTEQTPSGQSAIESAVSRAGQIESEQAPAQERLTQLETLRSQLSENPLVTQSGILNRLGRETGDIEKNLQDINNLYLARQVGLGANIIPQSINAQEMPGGGFAFESPTQYSRPSELGNVTQERIQEAKNQFDAYTQFESERNRLDREIAGTQERLDRVSRIRVNEGTGIDIGAAINKEREMADLRNDLVKFQNEKNQLFRKSSNLRTELIPLYQQYQNRLGMTRQQILSEYDPATLARIQAIGQLAGRGFEDMLGGRLS